jgi:hypothetical protein
MKYYQLLVHCKAHEGRLNEVGGNIFRGQRLVTIEVTEPYILEKVIEILGDSATLLDDCYKSFNEIEVPPLIDSVIDAFDSDVEEDEIKEGYLYFKVIQIIKL